MVILDYTMPEMTGLEVARHIRHCEKRINRPPVYIVCLTGHDDPLVVSECEQSGINLVLTKPIEKNKLLQVLKRL